jgi:hypothetical protein
MAVNARDIPITREMVQDWIEEARAASVNRRQYVRNKINALNLDDPFIDVSQRDDIKGPRIHIADLFDLDFGSYR